MCADLGADLVGGLAHARILLDLLDHLDRQHQQRRRHDHDPRAIGLLHDVVEAVVQFGIDGFRRHEHQRQVLGLAGDEVFLGDVVDVLVDVLPHALRRDLRSSSVLASRNAVTASSGNLASITSGRWSGRKTQQSGRLRFVSVNWNS